MLAERKRSRRAPGLSDLLRAVVNTLPVVVYALDGDGTILLSEGRGLEAMRSAPGESVGRNIREVFKDEPESLNHIELALAGDGHNAQLQLQRNGRDYHVWYVPSLNPDGSVRMVTGLALDVTEAAESRRQLRDLTYWLDRLVDTLPIAIFAVDREGRLSMARGSILGADISERIGRLVEETYDYIPQGLDAVRRAQAGEDCTFTVSNDREVDFAVGPIIEDGDVQGVIGVAIDVTEQVRAAAARTEAERQARFLALMSHELRTPLNSILGFSQLLANQEPDQLTRRQLRYVSHIKDSGEHLLTVVNDLLDISRVRAGQLRVDFLPVSPAALVGDVLDQMSVQARAEEVELVRGRQARTQVNADRGRLRQILLNLISNAIKFTPAGGRVEVRSLRAGDEVRFHVSDNGIGLSPADQELVFREFYQVPDVPATSPLRGTGLGLPLSRELARAMGGDVTVQSRIGEGSTFILSLPAHQPQED
ncbi:MAG TPA: PAS domain-containing sensor histidine kinase [Candidatus Dormibacteraeota bacterium]